MADNDPSRPAILDVSDIAQIFRRYAPYVARVGVRILGAGADVDDLVQDVFLDAQRGIGALRDPDAVRGWLARIAVRKARRRLRRRAVLRSLGLERGLDVSEALDPTTDGDRASVLAVYRILDRVPVEARIAWVLHRVEGESLEQVAEVIGCSRCHRSPADTTSPRGARGGVA